MSPEQEFIAWCWFEYEAETFDRGLPGVWHPHSPSEWMPRPDVAWISWDHAKATRARVQATGARWASRGRSAASKLTFAGWRDVMERAGLFAADGTLLPVERLLAESP